MTQITSEMVSAGLAAWGDTPGFCTAGDRVSAIYSAMRALEPPRVISLREAVELAPDQVRRTDALDVIELLKEAKQSTGDVRELLLEAAGAIIQKMKHAS